MIEYHFVIAGKKRIESFQDPNKRPTDCELEGTDHTHQILQNTHTFRAIKVIHTHLHKTLYFTSSQRLQSLGKKTQRIFQAHRLSSIRYVQVVRKHGFSSRRPVGAKTVSVSWHVAVEAGHAFRSK